MAIDIYREGQRFSQQKSSSIKYVGEFLQTLARRFSHQGLVHHVESTEELPTENPTPLRRLTVLGNSLVNEGQKQTTSQQEIPLEQSVVMRCAGEAILSLTDAFQSLPKMYEVMDLTREPRLDDFITDIMKHELFGLAKEQKEAGMKSFSPTSKEIHGAITRRTGITVAPETLYHWYHGISAPEEMILPQKSPKRKVSSDEILSTIRKYVSTLPFIESKRSVVELVSASLGISSPSVWVQIYHLPKEEDIFKNMKSRSDWVRKRYQEIYNAMPERKSKRAICIMIQQEILQLYQGMSVSTVTLMKDLKGWEIDSEGNLVGSPQEE